MIIDYHMHTKASPDGSGEFEDFIKEAKKKGIDEIGFSEHAMDVPRRPMDFMDGYVQRFLEIRKCSEIPVKLGVEADFFPEEVEEISVFIRKYPFDYVIGSVHCLKGWLIDSSSQMHAYLKKDILQVYEEYFETVGMLCESRLFDILGHPDLIKIFGFKPNHDIEDILEKTAEKIAENGACAEVNASGLVKKCAEIYPSRQFLEILRKHDVPIAFGSDAHKPEDVGRHFDKALKLARTVGYTHSCRFEDRKRENVKI